MAARHLPVLMYHHISPAPGLVTISPATFRAQMAWLAEAGWKALSTGEIEAFYRGEPLPAKSVAITFDDGYLDNWLHAHPVLAEFGLTAHLFLVTDWLGDGPPRTTGECPNHNTCKQRIAQSERDSVMLRWSEVEAMAGAGTFAFHSHTHTHTRWDRELSGNARLAAMERELSESAATLRQRLGTCSSHLCWPQGYYQPEYIDLAQRQGFQFLYTTKRLPNRRAGSALEIGRISTKEREEVDWLKQRLGLIATPLLADLYFLFQGRK